MRKLILPLLWMPAAGALAHDVEGQYTAFDALQWSAEPWVLLLLALSVVL